MLRSTIYRMCLAVSLFLAALIVVSNNGVTTSAISPLQSCVLPTGCPKETTAPDNPQFIFSRDGGRRYCGLDQSPVWVDFVKGFTVEGGAEVHCNLTPSLAAVDALNKRLLQGAWGNRGYLIGVYPQVPISKAIKMIFQVDPARAQGVCRTCFVGRVYDPEKNRWQDLPTTFDQRNLLVTIAIDRALPLSTYPSFPDRWLIALFRKR